MMFSKARIALDGPLRTSHSPYVVFITSFPSFIHKSILNKVTTVCRNVSITTHNIYKSIRLALWRYNN